MNTEESYNLFKKYSEYFMKYEILCMDADRLNAVSLSVYFGNEIFYRLFLGLCSQKQYQTVITRCL